MKRTLGIAMLAALLAAGSTLGISAAATNAGAATPARTVVPGTWKIVSSPSPLNQNNLSAVSCVTSSFCMAVGNAVTTAPNQTLAQKWDGTSWTTLTTPNVTGATTNALVGVSCPTTAYCVAVGTATVAGTAQTLIEQWSGGTWTILSSPNTSATTSNTLTGVNCTSLIVCTAVGTVGSTPTAALALQWNGTTWANVPTATSSNATTFSSVSCKSAAWCVAVGNTTVSGALQTLVEQWNGTAWSIVASPTPTAGGFLNGVACSGMTFCVAVGSVNSSPPTNLAEQWNGSTWTIAATPTGTLGGTLLGVSCVGPTSCVAVGFTTTSSGHVAQALAWNGSTWALQTTPNPPVTPVNTDLASLVGVSCVGGQSCTAVGAAPPDTTGTGIHTLIETAPITRPGYRFVASDGGVFDFGGAAFYGSTGNLTLNKPVVGMAVTPDGGGYWLVASDGGIFSFGDAMFYGSTGNLTLNKPIVGMAATPDGGGYWLVASDGGIFSFGDAVFFGSTGAIALNKPIVGMSTTPSGLGYWLVASDGGIFSFGNASFHGSTGALVLNKPVVGMATVPDGGGYWLVASDGGIFSFGDALFQGSTGALVLNKPVVGMAATSSGLGYWLVASDGGIFTFGDAGFSGSTGGIVLNKPIVGMTRLVVNVEPTGAGQATSAGSGSAHEVALGSTGSKLPLHVRRRDRRSGCQPGQLRSRSRVVDRPGLAAPPDPCSPERGR